jgi:putative phage-type endonuclease
MKTEVQVEQGTAEWLAMRRRLRMASETPAVLGVSPYANRASIRAAKVDGKGQYENAAMTKGKEQEPIARAAFEAMTGEIFRPAVFVNGEYGASLDGISLDGKSIIEIKVPWSTDNERFSLASIDSVAIYDFMQMQHQLMVCEAERCHYVLWNHQAQKYSTLEVLPNHEAWKTIQDAWDEFWPSIRSRDDDDWKALAQAYIAAKQELDKASAKLDEAKEKLLKARRTDTDFGYGVEVQKITREGAINWKKIQDKYLSQVSVDSYRAKPVTYFQIKS